MTRARITALLALLLLGLAVDPGRAQPLVDAVDAPWPGEEVEHADELRAWRLAVDDPPRRIQARELAERLTAEHPDSYVAELVLGHVQHYGEGNFPRALYHLNQAWRRFTTAHGDPPRADAPRLWHGRLILHLASTHGDLEHFDEQLAWLARYNAAFEDGMMAQRAWPLMKLRRYDDARTAARDGLATEEPRQIEVALNALCAIEFEAGRDTESYAACRRALDHARATGEPTVVDLTNFAEASRSVFRLDEAERTLQEATRARVSWYGNPWIELAELYTRQARFAEALAALREVGPYRARKEPHVRNSDMNEGRRALSAFFLAVGRPADALERTDVALVMPDRRAHNSRDPAQDRAIAALLDRRARRVAAEQRLEDAAGEPVHARLLAWVDATWLRLQGWTSGRQVSKAIGDEDRLVGFFRVGTSESAVLPPWLAGEMVEAVGAGVVREAIALARQRDPREGAGPYYDAFEAEAALGAGDDARALELGASAAGALGPTEVMLAARARAVAAEAARRLGRHDEMVRHYDAALQRDPGAFRRLGLALPVRVEASGALGPLVADVLDSSPRLEEAAAGLSLRIEADATGGRACLLGPGGAVLGCGEATAHAQDDADAVARRISRAFHAATFAPRIDLSQADASSLDGSNRVARDPLETLFD